MINFYSLITLIDYSTVRIRSVISYKIYIINFNIFIINNRKTIAWLYLFMNPIAIVEVIKTQE